MILSPTFITIREPCWNESFLTTGTKIGSISSNYSTNNSLPNRTANYKVFVNLEFLWLTTSIFYWLRFSQWMAWLFGSINKGTRLVANIITEFYTESESLANPKLRHLSWILYVIINLRKLNPSILHLDFHYDTRIYLWF